MTGYFSTTTCTSTGILTNAGILTFISRINTTSESLKARSFFICLKFSFYEQLKFRAQLSWTRKKVYNLGARVDFTGYFSINTRTSTGIVTNVGI